MKVEIDIPNDVINERRRLSRDYIDIRVGWQMKDPFIFATTDIPYAPYRLEMECEVLRDE